jgi:hypothetical protein
VIAVEEGFLLTIKSTQKGEQAVPNPTLRQRGHIKGTENDIGRTGLRGHHRSQRELENICWNLDHAEQMIGDTFVELD